MVKKKDETRQPNNVVISKLSMGALVYSIATMIRGGNPDYLIKGDFVVGEDKEKGLLIFQETDMKMLKKMAKEAKKPNPIVG
jgi:hypothetical protein